MPGRMSVVVRTVVRSSGLPEKRTAKQTRLVSCHSMLPIGYPMGRFGPVSAAGIPCSANDWRDPRNIHAPVHDSPLASANRGRMLLFTR